MSVRAEVRRPAVVFLFEANGGWRELLGTKVPAGHLAAAIAAGVVVADGKGVWVPRTVSRGYR